MRAKKSLGQNFLRDDSVIRRIVDALDLHKDETVVEIGPGRGSLTRALLEDAGRVIAIEFDRDLIIPLRERFGAFKNLELINADILSVDFAEILNTKKGKAKLVANLPYNISTPILGRLIDQRSLFSKLVLMFQREVVTRITAPPGGRDRGFLSVLVENAFHTEYLFDVQPKAFSPVPKVWSAVVRLTPKISTVSDESSFRDIVSASFAHKRKTILNNLKLNLGNAFDVLAIAEIDGKRRAETLTLDEWVRLADTISQTKKVGSRR